MPGLTRITNSTAVVLTSRPRDERLRPPHIRIGAAPDDSFGRTEHERREWLWLVHVGASVPGPGCHPTAVAEGVNRSRSRNRNERMAHHGSLVETWSAAADGTGPPVLEIPRG